MLPATHTPRPLGHLVGPVQGLVDELADRLQRSVAIDTAEMDLLVASRHFGDEDELRIQALKSRTVPPEFKSIPQTTGINKVKGYKRVPAMGEVKPRIGMPIRADGELAAILWLIDDDTVSQAELDDCLHTIHQVETIFERRLVSNLSAELQLEESLAGLLSDTYSDRRAAEEDLSDLGHFAACVGFTALVMRFDRESRGTIEDHEYRLLLRATKRALTPIPAQDRIFGRVNDFFVIVLGFRGAVLTEILQELADRLVKEADVLTPGAEARLHVGAGGRVTALTHVSDSVEQGILSLRAASATGVTTRLWDDPGVDLLLADLLPASLPPSRVPPVLRTIDDSVSPEVLQTVLAYLDHGGNIAKTSEDLFLHRTTAYYRLAKFEKATNLDLGDGRARLMVHLWLLSLPFLRRTEP